MDKICSSDHSFPVVIFRATVMRSLRTLNPVTVLIHAPLTSVKPVTNKKITQANNSTLGQYLVVFSYQKFSRRHWVSTKFGLRL